jgi:hypothetical protein
MPSLNTERSHAIARARKRRADDGVCDLIVDCEDRIPSGVHALIVQGIAMAWPADALGEDDLR